MLLLLVQSNKLCECHLRVVQTFVHGNQNGGVTRELNHRYIVEVTVDVQIVQKKLKNKLKRWAPKQNWNSLTQTGHSLRTSGVLLHIMAYTGSLRPKGGHFSVQVSKRIGISRVKVYERVQIVSFKPERFQRAFHLNILNRCRYVRVKATIFQ